MKKESLLRTRWRFSRRQHDLGRQDLSQAVQPLTRRGVPDQRSNAAITSSSILTAVIFTIPAGTSSRHLAPEVNSSSIFPCTKAPTELPTSDERSGSRALFFSRTLTALEKGAC